ncbi:MAG: zinc ribbon domain-containing protein [Sporolactobacillus sp.]
MKCQHCGEENTDSARFCKSCGHPLPAPSVAQAAQQTQTGSAAAPEAHTEDQSSFTLNSDMFSHYWGHLLTSIKHPGSGAGKGIAPAITTFILFLVFTVFSVIILVNNTINRVSTLGFGSASNRPQLGSNFFFNALFLSAVALIVYILLIFLALKLSRCNLSWRTVVAQLGNYFTFLLSVSVLLLITAFMSVQFYMIFLTIAMVALPIACYMTIFNLAKQAIIDPFYLTIAVQLIYTLIVYIVARQYITNYVMPYLPSNLFGF